jgi:hypothetical protein
MNAKNGKIRAGIIGIGNPARGLAEQIERLLWIVTGPA